MNNKSLITKDMAKLVQTSVKNGCKLTPYNFSRMDNFRIGKVRVWRGVRDDVDRPEVILFLDDDYDEQYAKLWNHDVGNVLAKELRKPEPKLFELKDELFTALVREIPSEDVDEQLMQGMVHLKIADTAYTIIKVLKKNENYLSHERLIDYDEDDTLDAPCVSESVLPKKNDVEPNSYELF